MKQRLYKGDLFLRYRAFQERSDEVNRIGLYNDLYTPILNKGFNLLNENNCILVNLDKEEMELWGSYPIDFMME
jgi:hypothetical protein